MPIRDYRCEKCQKTYECVELPHWEPLRTCPVCEEPVTQLVSASYAHFKGSGFYSTDYPKKNKGAKE